LHANRMVSQVASRPLPTLSTNRGIRAAASSSLSLAAQESLFWKGARPSHRSQIRPGFQTAVSAEVTMWRKLFEMPDADGEFFGRAIAVISGACMAQLNGPPTRPRATWKKSTGWKFLRPQGKRACRSGEGAVALPQPIHIETEGVFHWGNSKFVIFNHFCRFHAISFTYIYLVAKSRLARHVISAFYLGETISRFDRPVIRIHVVGTRYLHPQK
jgi:hypothetical protein